LRDRCVRKEARRVETADLRRSAGEKAPAAGDPVIAVCFGEFGPGEAESLCPLWEATWSQDARGKAAKK
jgi:hypothetical protein